MICPVCRAEIEDGVNICPVCGAEIIEDDNAAPSEMNEEEAEQDIELDDYSYDREPLQQHGEYEDTAWESDSDFQDGSEEETENMSKQSKPKKKSKLIPVVLIILSVLVCVQGCLLSYAIFFNKGQLPVGPSPAAIIKSIKYGLKKDGYAYIKNIDISYGLVENGTTTSGANGESYAFYTDPWIENWFSANDMAAIESYDSAYSAQGAKIEYFFDEEKMAKLKEKFGKFEELKTDYRIREEDSTITIVKTAKCSEQDLLFVFLYNYKEGIFQWEVGIE